jgi:hypothetical protein
MTCARLWDRSQYHFETRRFASGTMAMTTEMVIVAEAPVEALHVSGAEKPLIVKRMMTKAERTNSMLCIIMSQASVEEDAPKLIDSDDKVVSKASSIDTIWMGRMNALRYAKEPPWGSTSILRPQETEKLRLYDLLNQKQGPKGMAEGRGHCPPRRL